MEDAGLLTAKTNESLMRGRLRSFFTWKINDISRLLYAVENVNEVIAADKDLGEAMEIFRRAHEDYNQTLYSDSTLEERQKSSKMISTKISRRISTPSTDFARPFVTVSQVGSRIGKKVSLLTVDLVNPSDAISQAGSKFGGQRQFGASRTCSDRFGFDDLVFNLRNLS